MKTFADAEEALAVSLPGYESRVQQQRLAEAITEALANGEHLLAEAGTGTGKSLAYLIACILSGKRVVISTATKALQDQIFGKDIPFLQAHLGHPFTAAMLKGRANYFCGNRAADVDPGDCRSLPRILEAAKNSIWDGTKETIGFDIPDADWMKVCADSEECSASDCKETPQICYAERAKAEASIAAVVVVNHALFVTDLVIREATAGKANMLGQYSVVVFDEAHEIEEYAENALGSTFRESGIKGLVGEVNNFARKHASSIEESSQRVGKDLLKATMALWKSFDNNKALEDNNNLIDLKYLQTSVELFAAVNHHLGEMAELVRSVDCLNDRTSEAAVKRLRRIGSKTKSVAERFEAFVMESPDLSVRWVETTKTKRNEEIKVLRSAPLNVGWHLRPMLFAKEHITAILVSATLADNNGRFNFIAGRLGIDQYKTLDVGTPFDYEKQSGLYIPTTLPGGTRPFPSPKSDRMAWESLSVHHMLQLVQASKGRALLLFTSVKQMKTAYETIAPQVEYTCMKQGDQPNPVLAERFMADKHSVLFATKSFFTGVDFQGEACSLVVIDKLPFPVPSDPLVYAKCDAIDRKGGKSFASYVVPFMVLVLKQGIGRLIRHRNDFGVVAILDPRLATTGWGKGIIKALPKSQRLESFQEVVDFYDAA